MISQYKKFAKRLSFLYIIITMDKIITVNLEQMEVLVEKMVTNIKPGQILGLVGDLGAGKTTFVQILAKKLGIDERVNSPTFNLQKLYKLPESVNSIKQLLHVDAYRLKSVYELEDIGFFEMLADNETLAVVEWADQLPELENNNNNYLTIEFVGINNPNEREIKISENLLK